MRVIIGQNIQMARFVSKNGQFVDRDTGEPMAIPDRGYLATPLVISDIEPYQSPVDGAYVSGRAAKRDDMAKHNCVPYEDVAPSKNRSEKGKFRNKKFAEKRNLPLAEDAR